MALVPNPLDQNPWAHWRNPMDMIRHGWSTSIAMHLAGISVRRVEGITEAALGRAGAPAAEPRMWPAPGSVDTRLS